MVARAAAACLRLAVAAQARLSEVNLNGNAETMGLADNARAEEEPDSLRHSASFASDTLRFDIPVAAMNFRYKSCPKAHVVPDAAFPRDINAPMDVSASVAIGKEERPDLFGGVDLEAGQEAAGSLRRSLLHPCRCCRRLPPDLPP